MTSDSWLNFVFEFITGVGGLFLFILSLIIGAYWLLMPMMIISRLDKLLKLVEEEAERVRSTMRAQAPQTTSTPSLSKPIPPEAERFYVANGKDVVGPHDREKLTQLLQRQIITPKSLVCKEGSNQWLELGTIFKPATTPL